MTAPKTESAQDNGFMAILQRKEMTKGTLTELSEMLGKIALAVNATGKKGSLTLKMEILPEEGALRFDTSIKQVIPVERDPICLYYVTEDGKITRDDPNQRVFELKMQPGGKSEAPAEQAQKAV